MWKLIAEAQCRGVWVWLFVMSYLSVVDLSGSHLLGWSSGAVWLLICGVACLKASLIWGLYIFSRLRKWTRGVMIGLISIYSFFCILNGTCYGLYGFGISHRLVAVLIQTNARETSEFFSCLLPNIGASLSAKGIWIACLIIYGSLIGLRRITSREFLWLTGTLSVAGAVGLIVAIANMGQGRNVFFMSVRVPKNIVETFREHRAMDELIHSLRPLADAESVSSGHDAATIVMVIGESSTPDHWALYGYPLPTTPRISAMKDSLVVYEDALANSTTTALNLERILTLMNDDDKGNWYDYPLLIDIFNEAGYRTWWLSNQERLGIWSNTSGAMSSRANVVKYLGNESSEDALEYRYDEVLLPEFRKAMTDTASAKWIALHLMGSHNEYRLRYPTRFDKFTAKEEAGVHKGEWLNDKKLRTIAEYDNTLLYTDWILGEIIESVAKDPRPAVFVYFSDHGENIYSDRDFIGRDRNHVRVPMIVYANAAYRRAFPERMKRLEGASGKGISTSGIPYLLMGLSGTKYKGYDATRDISAEEYRERERYVDGEPSVFISR